MDATLYTLLNETYKMGHRGGSFVYSYDFSDMFHHQNDVDNQSQEPDMREIFSYLLQLYNGEHRSR